MDIFCDLSRLCNESGFRTPRPPLKKRFFRPAVFRPAFLALVALCCLSGCSGSSSEIKLEPVKGTLIVDGKKVAGVSVLFNATGEGFGASGVTSSNGQYELVFRDGRKGVPAGSYKVTYSQLGMPDGSAIPDFIASPSEVGAVEMIPERFRDLSKIDKTVTVPEGGTTIDLELHLK